MWSSFGALEFVPLNYQLPGGGRGPRPTPGTHSPLGNDCTGSAHPSPRRPEIEPEIAGCERSVELYTMEQSCGHISHSR